jgi:hypothetical protein
MDELERADPPDEDEAAAGRAGTAEYRQQQRLEERRRRKADKWRDVAVGSTLKVTILLGEEGVATDYVGTVLRVEEGHLFEETEQYEDGAEVDFPRDGTRHWVGRITDGWELVDPEEQSRRKSGRKRRRPALPDM